MSLLKYRHGPESKFQEPAELLLRLEKRDLDKIEAIAARNKATRQAIIRQLIGAFLYDTPPPSRQALLPDEPVQWDSPGRGSLGGGRAEERSPVHRAGRSRVDPDAKPGWD
jgi:hypothetical protein